MYTKRSYHAGVAIDREHYVVIQGWNEENKLRLKTLDMFNNQTKQGIDIPLKMSYERSNCLAFFCKWQNLCHGIQC